MEDNNIIKNTEEPKVGSNPEVIDLREVFKKVWERKKLYVKVMTIVFILSCIWIFPQPRIYTTSVSLAPESSAAVEGGSLSSLASSFGVNLGGMDSNDAFYPLLYPDVIASSNFIVSLFDIQVKNADGDIQTDYYTYLKDYQKKNVLTQPVRWLKKQIINLFPKKKDALSGGTGEDKIDPFCLSEEQDALVEQVRASISCDVDIKTEVITIKVEDQDRLICACLADSIRERLQNFIIDYRTKKSRRDVDHYQKLADEAYAKYENATKAYADYCDTHNNMILQAYITERDALENEMQVSYSAYQAFLTQLQASSAKLQERTPAFTILQCATVPLKPAKPKRMLFVLGMLFLSVIGTSIYILKDDIFATK